MWSDVQNDGGTSAPQDTIPAKSVSDPVGQPRSLAVYTEDTDLSSQPHAPQFDVCNERHDFFITVV